MRCECLTCAYFRNKQTSILAWSLTWELDWVKSLIQTSILDMALLLSHHH